MRPKATDPRIEPACGHLQIKSLFIFYMVIKMEFKTLSGNEYVYLPENGIVYPKKALKRFAKIERFEKSVEGEKINLDDIENPDVVKELILRSGLQQLILEITQKCNLRCKYCVYSESYPGVRGYNPKDMSEDTALKAIDFYFSLLKEGRAYNPYREPSIAFYGGEPLLNFELIKTCITHVIENYKDFNPYFVMTINSTLLSEEIVTFMSQYNCEIVLSIDGPRAEHDRNRVFPGGKGSFDLIMENVKALGGSNLKVYCQSVYDFKTDIDKVHEFFLREDVPLLSGADPVSNKIPNTYYDKFSARDRKIHEERLAKMLTYQIEKVRNEKGKRKKERKRKGERKGKISLYDLHLMNLVTSVLNRYTGKYKDPYIPFTSSGVPGFKLFADAFGFFRICERTFGDVAIIGDVESGLDYEKILHILQWLRSETAVCESCVAKNMCSLCYVTFASGPAIKRDPAVCEDVKMRLEGMFSHVWSIAEVDENVLHEMADEYYTLFENIGKELL